MSITDRLRARFRDTPPEQKPPPTLPIHIERQVVILERHYTNPLPDGTVESTQYMTKLLDLDPTIPLDATVERLLISLGLK